VIHKAIERDPAHRYQTAAGLAEDLKRFLEDRPIRSRRIGEVEKFARWCRRNPVPAGLLAALVLVFWVGFGGVAWKWREAVAEREAREVQVVKANAAEGAARLSADRALGEEKKAVQAADRAGRRLYFSLIDRARLEHQAGNIAEAESILDRCEPASRGWEWHFLKRLDNAELLTLRGHDDGWVDTVAFSPDGKWIATAGGGNPYFKNTGAKVVPGTVVVWDAETGRPAHTLRAHKHLVRQVAFSRDSRIVASSSLDGTVQLHEVATGRLVRTLVTRKADAGRVPYWSELLALTPDGRRLATGTDDGTVAVWDLAAGTRSPLLRVRDDLYAQAVFSPDARWLATLSGYNREVGGTARVWDAVTGAEAAPLERHVSVCSLAVSPDCRTLAAGSADGDLFVQNLADGKLRQTLAGHEGWVLGLAFSPDGMYLASAGQDRTVRVWDIESGTSVRVIRGHTDIVTCVAFSPDGDRLVTGSQDGTARVWDLTFVDETGNRDYGGFYIKAAPEAIAYARGGREYRVFEGNGAIDRSETGSFGDLGQIVTDLQVPWRTPAEPAAFDAEGRRVIAIDRGAPREAVCLDLDEVPRRTILRGHSLEILHATLSADGTRAATAALSQTPESRDEVFVWDVAAASVLHRREIAGERIARVALDPTGRRLALSASRAGSTDNGSWSRAASFVAVVDVDTGREILRREIPDDRCLALGFRGDGRRLAAAGIDRTVLIWDLESGGAALHSRQGPELAMDLAFSPDGLRLAVASRQQVKLMDTETAEEVLTLRGRAQLVPNTHGFNPRVRFSPDGRSLLAICHDSTWEPLAVWSSPQDDPGEPAARQRMARRRAVTRHLGLAERFPTQRGPERLIALDHLDHAARLGLESPLAIMSWAGILAGLDLGGEATAYLDRAVALMPDDDESLAQVAYAWAMNGRFHAAGACYARMSSLPPFLFNFLNEQGVALVLAGDHARYRQLCAEAVRRSEANPGPWSDPRNVAYFIALEPVSGIDADTRIRIARRGYDGASEAKDGSRRFSAGLTLGAAHVRAGAPARAEPIFREAIAHAPDEVLRALGAAWLAIATRHQGRHDEAKTWFDRADRFVHERLPHERPELEHRTPGDVGFVDWCRLLIAWREAQGLLLDADFPADPFAP
jgi:eukaryotic-like serine/threonine-protein kinase